MLKTPCSRIGILKGCKSIKRQWDAKILGWRKSKKVARCLLLFLVAASSTNDLNCGCIKFRPSDV